MQHIPVVESSSFFIYTYIKFVYIRASNFNSDYADGFVDGFFLKGKYYDHIL
jgi:hypothetical protein